MSWSPDTGERRTLGTGAQVWELVRQAVPQGDFVPAVLGRQLLEKLMKEHPALLKAWMFEKALRSIIQQLTEHLELRRSGERLPAKRESKRESFAVAAQTRDVERLGFFDLRFAVDANRTKRRLGEMTGADHTFVAQTYTHVEKRAAMEAAFHHALARRVGDRRTDQVIDPEECERMYASIVGAPRPDPKSIPAA